LIICNNNLT